LFKVDYMMLGTNELYKTKYFRTENVLDCKAAVVEMYNRITGKSDCWMRRLHHLFYRVYSNKRVIGYAQITCL